ncbi:MAG: hypothetical protein JSW25_02385, partial [Thermoplasmata archaeon]
MYTLGPIGGPEDEEVRFELRGAIVFSGDLGPAAEALAGYLEEIQAGPLQRGVPEGEEGPRVEGHTV